MSQKIRKLEIMFFYVILFFLTLKKMSKQTYISVFIISILYKIKFTEAREILNNLIIREGLNEKQALNFVVYCHKYNINLFD